MNNSFRLLIFALLVLIGACNSVDKIPVPEDWWQIAAVPDLGEYNRDGMEPVDFAIWQAADGTWQLVSCIRFCGKDGARRVLHRWEGASLTDTMWSPRGIFMLPDTTVGEQDGWIQAPYVVKKEQNFRFYYGGGGQICLAEGKDGKNFRRVIREDGRTRVFEGQEYGRTRDIMIMLYDGKYYGYYTGSEIYKWPEDTRGAVFCRVSDDLEEWGEEHKVSETEEDVVQFLSSECPQVIPLGGQFYLFKTQEYKPGHQLTTVFRSGDPLNFGIQSDSMKIHRLPLAAPEIFKYEGSYYIAALMPDLKGIRISRLKWESKLK